MKKIIVALCMACGLSGIGLLGCINRINGLENECQTLKNDNMKYINEINYSHELLNEVYSSNKEFVDSYLESFKDDGQSNPTGIIYTGEFEWTDFQGFAED